jgi:hypothetical protein
MKTVREAIDAGVAAHGQWKARLRRVADSGKADVTVADASRDDGCEFGKWLKGEAARLSPAEKGTDLDKVKKLHDEFHRVAGSTLGAALRGDRKAYDVAVAIDGPFAKASIALMGALTSWKGRLPAK